MKIGGDNKNPRRAEEFIIFTRWLYIERGFSTTIIIAKKYFLVKFKMKFG